MEPEIEVNNKEQEPEKTTGVLARWVKRFGVAGFLFFLIKGLLWLIIPGLIAYFSLS
jgi:hypothetical protein